MTKRRIVNGLVYVWTRRGWRQVKDGCIRTLEGLAVDAARSSEVENRRKVCQ